MRLRSDRRSERQKEAQTRNIAWVSLSTKDKLESLKRRSGVSLRQVTHLTQAKEAIHVAGKDSMASRQATQGKSNHPRHGRRRGKSHTSASRQGTTLAQATGVSET